MPQTSDKANMKNGKVAGTHYGDSLRVNPDMPTGAAPDGVSPSGNTTSGTSQSDRRGPQGTGK